MAIFKTLKEAIYNTVHRNSKDINFIAEEIGCSPNTLYRYCNDEDTTSFAELPLRRLLPLINSTNDDSILDYLESRRGRIAFKVPRVPASKEQDSEIVRQYQTCTIEAIHALNRFFARPNSNNLKAVEEALTEVIRASASCKNLVSKKAAGQLEFTI
jgi:hypothetical protein